MLPKPEPAAGQLWRYKNKHGYEDTLCLLYTESNILRVLWLKGNSMAQVFYSIEGQLAKHLSLNEDEYSYVGTLNGELLVEKIKALSEANND